MRYGGDRLDDLIQYWSEVEKQFFGWTFKIERCLCGSKSLQVCFDFPNNQTLNFNHDMTLKFHNKLWACGTQKAEILASWTKELCFCCEVYVWFENLKSIWTQCGRSFRRVMRAQDS